MPPIEYITITIIFTDGTKRRCRVLGEDLSWTEEQVIQERLGFPSKSWAWCEGTGV